MRYVSHVIVSFGSELDALKLPYTLLTIPQHKLGYLDAAATLEDLRSPLGSRLEVLPGDRAGRRSARVNDQFQVCFTWKESNAESVEIVDYRKYGASHDPPR